MKKPIVAVGMSGGVDSSVSALLLKEQGYEVFGLFMRNWEEGEDCPAEADYADMARVCEQIGIPYYTVNFTKEYWDEVFSECLDGFAKGVTPNPDILCNRQIKFSHLLEKAKRLGADKLATGHYCQIGETDGRTTLLKGFDPNKDQSYFLHAVSHEKLGDTLFPIGHLPKPEVRKIAREHNLYTHAKKDSTGICFIGKRAFRPFLSQYLKPKPGPFKTLEGKVLGQHEGSHLYTIGQRKGLGIGGPGEAWFVADKAHEENTVYLVQGENHPALFQSKVVASDAFWIAGTAPNFPFSCTAKIRYRQEDSPCTLDSSGEQLIAKFEKPQRAVTPGQSIVFYDGARCLGGAIIKPCVK
ncbi:MAG: tRNA 2-thiouridine(34) synthase MnmA [Candidatus Algichlamydia australiensis]|nr:tRNA 2-thiouridine(34) synthase MnmA [Chlamydiales bacterium]